VKISMTDVVKQEKNLSKPLTQGLLASFLFAGLIAVGSKISFYLPFTDVPVSLQVFFILLAGGVLGPRLGALSVVEYLAAGSAGLPVFADPTTGPIVFFGPTGGYLIGFIVAAAFVGYCVERIDSAWMLALFVWLGAMLILLFGGLWLHFGLARPWPITLATGVLPFLAVDTLKSLAAWSILVKTRR
jgi:biotin transport system substrate-specific component